MKLSGLNLSEKSFGNLGVHIRNQISYSLSPYEQKAFAGFFKDGLPNLFRRFRGQVFFILPPFACLALVIAYAKTTHHHLGRKNPADYENDE